MKNNKILFLIGLTVDLLFIIAFAVLLNYNLVSIVLILTLVGILLAAVNIIIVSKLLTKHLNSKTAITPAETKPKPNNLTVTELEPNNPIESESVPNNPAETEPGKKNINKCPKMSSSLKPEIVSVEFRLEDNSPILGLAKK